jgi:hypothetical protein
MRFSDGLPGQKARAEHSSAQWFSRFLAGIAPNEQDQEDETVISVINRNRLAVIQTCKVVVCFFLRYAKCAITSQSASGWQPDTPVDYVDYADDEIDYTDYANRTIQ